jgi:uncharacterized damage-inducible protein DinB
MNELARALIGDSYAAPPKNILEGLSSTLAHRELADVPHTVYEELWHMAFWQDVTLDWISGVETQFPATPNNGFPGRVDFERETWDELCLRFLEGSENAAKITEDSEKLEQMIRCPSRPGAPDRWMSVREQLESLVAHNGYHLGRIVLLRQLMKAWPPPSGGFNW